MKTSFPRCRVVPLPDYQASFQIDGDERLRWHFGPHYERPFFYPLRGPSGHALTRIGHPGAPDHDHHRSIWFAHHRVLGIDFWGNTSAARIRQKAWQVYHDADDQCVMASLLSWTDGHDPGELIEQQLIAAVRPGEQGETFLEIQTSFRPQAELLEFGQTNFGFLAVRVAKHLAAHFGAGMLTDSENRQGEAQIFAQSAKWLDYSGPAPPDSSVAAEGITYFDHPANPHHPTHWHVRDDGWMGAAVCLQQPVLTRRDQPLVLRYLLHAHAGLVDHRRANQVFAEFAASPAWVVQNAGRPHEALEVVRKS